MEHLLRTKNFEVWKYIDVGKVEMEEALTNFSDQIEKDDLVLFYFSGHGFCYDGHTFIAPNEMVTIGSEVDIKDNFFGFPYILGKIVVKEPACKIFLFDSCRSRIYSKISVKGIEAEVDKEIGGNIEYARIHESKQGRNILIAYATSDSNVARCGQNSMSTWTGHVYTEWDQESVELWQSFKNIRKKMKESNILQIPWEYEDLEGVLII